MNDTQLSFFPEEPPVQIVKTKTNAPRLGKVEIGQLLTVQLPDERTRAEVTEVTDQDNIKAKLIITPMSKSHHYRLNEVLSFRRIEGGMGDKWEVV